MHHLRTNQGGRSDQEMARVLIAAIIVSVSAGQEVLWTRPPGSSVILLPSSGCERVECQVKESRAGWEIGENGSFTGRHQLISADDELDSETIFSVNFTATFNGNFSQLMICGTEQNRTRVTVRCIAHELYSLPYDHHFTVEVYGRSNKLRGIKLDNMSCLLSWMRPTNIPDNVTLNYSIFTNESSIPPKYTTSESVNLSEMMPQGCPDCPVELSLVAINDVGMSEPAIFHYDRQSCTQHTTAIVAHSVLCPTVVLLQCMSPNKSDCVFIVGEIQHNHGKCINVESLQQVSAFERLGGSVLHMKHEMDDNGLLSSCRNHCLNSSSNQSSGQVIVIILLLLTGALDLNL